MRCKCGTGRDPVTGKMPVPQVLLLKSPHYINRHLQQLLWRRLILRLT